LEIVNLLVPISNVNSEASPGQVTPIMFAIENG
jgi:hypothetical protein